MKKIGVLVLALVAAAVVAADGDQRQVLSVSAAQRAHVLHEMRALLAGTHGIVAALAREDLAAVATHARAIGTGMARKAEDHLAGALPPDFMQLGMAVHRDFDQIAADAEARRDPRLALEQLGDAMAKCVACHASYQLRTVDAAAAPLRHEH